MTTFQKPVFQRGGEAISPPQKVTHPSLLLPGHAGRGVKDLRAMSLSRVRLTISSNQAVTVSVAHVLTWDSAEIDTDQYESSSSNRITAPFTGQYLVDFTVQWAVDSSNYRQAYVEHSTDAVTFSTVNRLLSNQAALTGYATINHACALYKMNKGDQLRVSVFEDSATGNLNVTHAYFGVMFCGPS